MAPSRRKGGASKAAAAAAAARRQWKVGDLVLAKVKGFPAWPASVGEPGSLGYSTDWKKVLVHFYGTQQIAFCNPADVEAFTEEKKQSLLTKRHGKGSDFVRAVREIIEKYEEQQQKEDQLGLKDQLEDPEAPLGSKLNSSHSIADGNGDSLPVDDGSATALVDEVDKKEEPTDTEVVTEPPLGTVYSSRKRTRDSPSQNGFSRGKEPIVRRSRSSSRLESRKLQDTIAQSSDTDINSGSISNTVVCDGLLRRNKSRRKSFEASERKDADSSAFASSGSIEDTSSEVVTVESHNFCLNEVSNMDSGCRIEHPEPTVGCSADDVDLSKGLDLQMKSVVIKKKRKPNRKRPTSDAVETAASVNKDDDFPNTSDSSRNDFDKIGGSCHKENGDEHLPLVKRARVRMGESSLKEPNSLRNPEESIHKEHMVHTSGEINESSECSDPLNGEPFRIIAAPCPSPSGCGPQFQGSKANLWKAIKDQSFGSVDGEAALPPSKRLHRALEAMSANAAEEDQSCYGASRDMNIPANGTLSSSVCRSPCEAIASTSPIVCNVESIGADAQHSDASGLGASSNPMPGEIVEPLLKTNLNSHRVENSNTQNNEPDKEIFPDADQENMCEGSHGGAIIPATVISQSPGRLLSSPCGKESVQRSVQGSEELSSPKDQAKTESDELVHVRSETDKKSDLNERTVMSMDLLSDAQDDDMEVSPQTDTCALLHIESACFDNSRASDDKREENDTCEVVTEVMNKQLPEELSSKSFPAGYLCDGLGIHSSPCLTDGGNSLSQASPFNASSGLVSTSDNSSFIQNNGSCSPDVHLCDKSASQPLFVDEERKFESLVSQRPKSVDEPNAALSSFEALLGSLTRTKESIARATRLAFDCAKFGASSKVVDVLAHFLESESSLPRRVDFFFLVDSIVKGDVGGLYTSSIQAMLPRLVAAAVPPGSSAHENRRQCLKVLRLWLEKKILSESVIRRHMRELDSYAHSTAGVFSRRSMRTERSFDDPLREMEGMLVDEYGSNSSFQLQGFCMPSMVKEEDGGSDSDGGSFEAVTPERSPENCEDHPAIPTIEKHRHILEDVDGELEMEDVAPTCEAELNSSSGGIEACAAHVLSQNQFEQHFSQPFAPPLPYDVPPSSPPLPSSPPPPTRPHRPSPPHSAAAMSDTYANGPDSKLYSEHMQDNISRQSNAGRMNQAMSDTARYHGSDHRDIQRQMPDSFPGRNYHSKNYPLRPPHPPPSNQFSYAREPNFKSRREVCPPPPSHSHRYQLEQNWDRENFYNNHERMKMPPREPDDSWRFPPHSFSGPRYTGKGKFYEPDPFVGPPSEHSRYHNQGWRHPPRSMNHRNSMPFRPPLDGPIPVSNRGPGYWQPR